jgi:hypothetical protein
METREVLTGDVSTLIFQKEYTNYAWGYQHFGWMMDNSGKVQRFRKTAKWVFPDSLGYVSDLDMFKNLGQCDSVMAKVDPVSFTQYATKAQTCMNGPFSTRKMVMADAGQNIDAIYLYEPEKKRYKRVLLNMTGDWAQENLSVEAKTIVDWMDKISTKY